MFWHHVSRHQPCPRAQPPQTVNLEENVTAAEENGINSELGPGLDPTATALTSFMGLAIN